MKNRKSLTGLFIIAVLFLTSCSANRVVQYQSETESTSTIKVKPSTKLRDVVVTLDGNLIWEKSRKVKSLTIQNVPAGSHELRVTSASWVYKNEINHTSNIEVKGKGETKTELVSVPPYSAGYWVYSGIVYLVAVSIWFL
jgi:hypothetical protein